MAPDDEIPEDLLEQIKKLKRRREEISGDTNRIMIEQRQLDQSAVQYLEIPEEMSQPSPVQRGSGPTVTCHCGKTVLARFKHCPHCGSELAEP
jgi:hypothetical protein